MFASSNSLRTIRWFLWGLVVLAAAGFAWARWWQQARPVPFSATQVAEDVIKSDFSLIDHNGRLVTDEDFRGKWLIVFFGFTNCPDICPTTLNEIAEVMERLGDKAPQVQPLFVSIDPERDGPEQMAEYVAAFDPRIVGLTGSAQQIEASARSFRVFYAKEVQENAPDGYLMAHTSVTYLIDPSGRFVRPYSYGTSYDEILSDLRSRF